MTRRVKILRNMAAGLAAFALLLVVAANSDRFARNGFRNYVRRKK